MTITSIQKDGETHFSLLLNNVEMLRIFTALCAKLGGKIGVHPVHLAHAMLCTTEETFNDPDNSSKELDPILYAIAVAVRSQKPTEKDNERLMEATLEMLKD